MLRFRNRSKKLSAWITLFSLIFATCFLPTPKIGAADHGDAPASSNDRSCDIADVYLFLDPNDNSKVIVGMTVQGFIVPAEAANFGIFDPNVGYLFDLETTGDAVPDQQIEVTFSEKATSATTPQTAYVGSSFFPTFSAPTTVANLNPTGPDPVVTTDPATGISVFAGLVDDPFFFDIPGFNRFVASVLASSPNAAALNRGRDSFAGYNTLAIALSIPISYLQSKVPVVGNSLGVVGRTGRRIPTVPPAAPRLGYTQVDRMGIPAVNVALIPFARKNEYNRALPINDANGQFAGDIVSLLRRLGTNDTNIGVLASVAVAKGDILRLNLGQPNTGSGGGTNAAAAFPNGRRLGDDVVDTILFFIANQNKLGDNVNSNDVPFRNQFPFFGAAQQPRDSGIDDNTRN
ncbi:MAG: DUF4331 family protein [Acidobacteria bacterium]|nr:DUF4331 family protein [Acidobacteriota bacterium]